MTTLPADSQPLRRNSVSLDQLRLLYQHADNLDKLMICLALNCGLAPADMGRLTANNVSLASTNSAIEHIPQGYAVLRLAQRTADVLREYLLWPETLELLQWAIEQAKELGTHELLISDRGKPMLNAQSPNPSSAITNRFRRLVDRAQQENPELRRVRLRCVREFGAREIMYLHTAEIASLYLGHRPTSHSMLRMYLISPYGRLHLALLDLRDRVRPVFTVDHASILDTCGHSVSSSC